MHVGTGDGGLERSAFPCDFYHRRLTAFAALLDWFQPDLDQDAHFHPAKLRPYLWGRAPLVTDQIIKVLFPPAMLQSVLGFQAFFADSRVVV